MRQKLLPVVRHEGDLRRLTPALEPPAATRSVLTDTCNSIIIVGSVSQPPG